MAVTKKGKVYRFSWRGKKREFTEDEIGKVKKALIKRMTNDYNRMEGTLNAYEEEYKSLVDASWDVWKFAAKFMTPNAELNRPKNSIKAARNALRAYKGLISSGTNDSLKKALKKFQGVAASVNVVASDVNDLAKELGQSGKVCEEMSIEVRDQMFDVVVLILTAKGVNPAVAGAGVGAFKSGLQEALNSKIITNEWARQGGRKGSAKRILASTLMGGATGVLSMLMNQAMMKLLGDRIVKIALTRPVGKKVAEKLITSLSARGPTARILMLAKKQIGEEAALKILVNTFNRILFKVNIKSCLNQSLKDHKAEWQRAGEKALASGKKLSDDYIADKTLEYVSFGLILDMCLCVVQTNRKEFEALLTKEAKKARVDLAEAS